MKKRKSNRLKGYDYSKNNLYFITNCVKDNICCLGRVVSVGTGRDLSVPHPDNQNPDDEIPNNQNPNNEIPNNQNPNNQNPNNQNPDDEIPNNQNPDNQIPNNQNPNNEIPELKFQVVLNQFGLIVEEKINWLMRQYPYVEIHNYVVMPNHFHFILEIDNRKVKGLEIKIKSVSSLLGALKTTSSKEIHNLGFEDFAWHRSFHDHIIRDEKSYHNISNYIDSNPKKWFQDKFFMKY